MKENETANEKNFRLLNERFGNENEPAFENRFQIKIELDFRNEPLQLKIIDIDGNENEYEIERLTGNGIETTLHLKNENENEL